MLISLRHGNCSGFAIMGKVATMPETALYFGETESGVGIGGVLLIT